MATSENFVKVRYATESECEFASYQEAKKKGLDMIHNRYALAWDKDDEGWFVLVPEQSDEGDPTYRP